MPFPSLKSIQAFEATARHLSFSLAAKELYVSQSAVSHQVKSLEKALGKPLFQRQNNRISLTVYGDALYLVARESFARLKTITDNLSYQSKFKIRVMAQSAIAIDWLARRSVHFQQQHADIEVEIAMAVSDTDFDPFDYDVIVATWPQPDNFKSEAIRKEQWYPVCTPELLATIDLSSPTNLLHHTLFSSENKQDWKMWMKQYRIETIEEAELQLFSNTILATKAALSGLGVALSCDFLCYDLVKQKQLAAIKQWPYDLPWGNFTIHYRENSHLSEQIQIFKNWIIKTSQDERL
ncbi:LysR family transcriptional regulator [Planctobacterium marinum]|uniref:Transcriptional regulator GcvA n=1 Tax=Planctobacterium marinum TaxID=1631968 RepID=A0AA48HJS7_9ALTE|nr:transcriptional regulator GcvA [Planctobacterium marinum]